ncbi:MAG: hypothetical protein ABIQ11_04175 [Saprospiraceae bacterium]
MKYFFTLLLVVTLAFSAKSQLWFDAGVKGAYGPTMMLDGNIFDSGNYKHKLSTGHAIGGRLGVNFGYHAGVSLEYMSAKSRQDFEFSSNPHSRFIWKHNDILLMFRYSGNGAYVEIGGKYSNMGDVTLERYNPDVTTDVSEIFENSYMSGVFGFGSYLLGSDLFTLNLGIRLHYSFEDMVAADGKENFYPLEMDLTPDLNKKTVATAAQLQAEFNYAFGRFSKEACQNRWKLLLFQ